MQQILGLDICRDTLVGDAMHRGISGGQKKRVTTGKLLTFFFFHIRCNTFKLEMPSPFVTSHMKDSVVVVVLSHYGGRSNLNAGEMIVGPTKTLFMDEISTGLDSSTTYQIVKCLQQIVHLTEGTIFMSLLQPAPETFDLFDDIILLSEGQIVCIRVLEHKFWNSLRAADLHALREKEPRTSCKR